MNPHTGPDSIGQEFQSIFTCSCGKTLPEIGPLPDWARWLAFNCTGWSASSEPGTDEFFERIDRLPEPGSVQLLNVDEHFGVPKPGNPVLVLFMPPDSSINGPDSSPAEIPLSGLVQVELIEIVSQSKSHAWLSVRVLDVYRFTEFFSLVPPYLNPSPLPQLMCSGKVESVQYENLAYSYSSEDDGFAWTLCQRHHGRWHLLMHSLWSYHSEEIHVGNRTLTPEEAASLGLQAKHGSDTN